MKRYVGISAYRYGGWREAPNKLTPEEVEAAKHAPVKGAAMTQECAIEGQHEQCLGMVEDGYECGCVCHLEDDE